MIKLFKIVIMNKVSNLKMHRDEKQCGILNYILEQKKDIRRKTGKIRIKDLVKFCTDVNFLVLTNVLRLCKSGP